MVLIMVKVNSSVSHLLLEFEGGEPLQTCLSFYANHRDMTRVQMLAKMFNHFKLLCWLFMGPTLGFWHKAKKQFFWSNLVFFTIKTRFWQYYSYLNMRKSPFGVEFLVLLGPIISRFFACSNEEKINQNNKGWVP